VCFIYYVSCHIYFFLLIKLALGYTENCIITVCILYRLMSNSQENFLEDTVATTNRLYNIDLHSDE